MSKRIRESGRNGAAGSQRLEEPADPRRVETRMAAPGFLAKNIRITALPDAILVRARASDVKETDVGGVHSSQSRERFLFRRIDVPGIDPNRVTAKLREGVLIVSAECAQLPKALARI